MPLAEILQVIPGEYQPLKDCRKRSGSNLIKMTVAQTVLAEVDFQNQ
jgi:hypothetical protein